MTIQNITGRALGVASLLFVAFAGGVSFRDFHGVRSAQDLRSAVMLVPQRLETAYMTAAQGQTAEYTPYQTYADVLTTLRANYYGKDIDPTQMTYNGIRGMMGSLKDRYTRFMDPKAYQDMVDDNHGEFVGIGALLGTNKAEQIYVVRVLQGGPALRYKVMAGDIILKVDGKSTLKMKDTAVVKLIRGAAGTKVTLTLLRKDAPQPVVITMPRETVQQEVVQHSIIDPVNKIGYISLSVFNEESDVQIDKALLDLQGQGVKGLILDLRENPGGLLDIAQRVASRFVPSGPIVWIKDRTGPMQSLDVIPSLHKNHMHYPLVVLVNGDSASASEIVSGAIKDTGSGTLVGEKTFGKGLVQTIMGLRDGSAVAITTQHYYTAMKHDINHKGIEPNITVSYTDDDQRKMYAYLREHPEAFYDLKNDTQLQRALTELVQRTRVASARPWE
ncbi:peptidase S41 [Capsulimonas corticalis]|uniref:Peptidase S41 n=1 Tax=Capsulimonas corticalis TaxID=2219043 RepID=A0A402D516_9BACT|nr:S41 family peptidase [Capsulimonas corticalis]BDI31969.1 peptidase S41 [Capsulimonas corticalis]